MQENRGRTADWWVPHPLGNYRHSFFISHVREDLTNVRRLKRSLDRRIRLSSPHVPPCFLDCDDWPHGKPTAPAIRDALGASEFPVVWVTPRFMNSSRGWIWFELAYGQLIEQSLNLGRPDWALPYVLAVFREIDIESVAPSPLLEYWGRSVVAAHESLNVAKIAERLAKVRTRHLPERNSPFAAS
ncbi:MAG: hypothetical protein SFV23_06045 [Planctomycetaceae bacterium]|nr:hypothetical protein [Planctomycetaceae bacterium]